MTRLVSVIIRMNESNKQEVVLKGISRAAEPSTDYILGLEQTVMTHRRDGTPTKTYMGTVDFVSGTWEEMMRFIPSMIDGLADAFIKLTKMGPPPKK